MRTTLVLEFASVDEHDVRVNVAAMAAAMMEVTVKVVRGVREWFLMRRR
jgi:hypothetical protein